MRAVATEGACGVGAAGLDWAAARWTAATAASTSVMGLS
jgi:hypothetical protein